jgi:hypothetical protein
MRYFQLIVFLSFTAFRAEAQEPGKKYDFPLTVTIHFPALGMPFRNLDLNFRNIGVGLGTEVTLNNDGTLVQQVHVAWLRNRQAGNGLLAYTQLAWRPEIGDNGFAEVKAGAGYLHAFTASSAFKPTGGAWSSAGHQGKGMLTLPLGVAFGYHAYDEEIRYTPTVGYQFMVVTHYNKTIALMPQTLVQTGIIVAR